MDESTGILSEATFYYIFFVVRIRFIWNFIIFALLKPVGGINLVVSISAKPHNLLKIN